MKTKSGGGLEFQPVKALNQTPSQAKKIIEAIACWIALAGISSYLAWVTYKWLMLGLPK